MALVTPGGSAVLGWCRWGRGGLGHGWLVSCRRWQQGACMTSASLPSTSKNEADKNLFEWISDQRGWPQIATNTWKPQSGEIALGHSNHRQMNNKTKPLWKNGLFCVQNKETHINKTSFTASAWIVLNRQTWRLHSSRHSSEVKRNTFPVDCKLFYPPIPGT